MKYLFHEIHQLVDSATTKRIHAHSSVWKDLLNKICSLTHPSDLIKNVLNNEAHINDVSKMSYRHINGFDKIVLYSSGDNLFKLRLHIWWPTEAAYSREHIHNHRWDFATYIVLGSYRLETYVQSKEGEPVYSYSYWSPENQSTYKMVPRGCTHAKKMFDVNVFKGNIYQLEHSVLHRVTQLTKSGTVSLVLQGPPLNRNTRVLTDSLVLNPSSMPAERFSINSIATKLEGCLDLLNRESYL
jgi:hypothetical protein